MLRRAPTSGVVRYVVFAAVLASVPAVFTRVPFFTMATAVEMALLAIGNVGLILVSGYAGQISIGQAAFYGTGAYCSAILTTRSGLAPPLALLIGAALSAVFAWLVGLAIFRVRGHYLALATLAFGLVAFHVANQLEVTGGPSGIVDIPKLALGVVLTSDLRYYVLVAAVLFVAVAVADNIVRSPLGLSLRALGDAETAAAASGIDIRRHKVIVFVVAAVFASVAGSLYAHWVTFVEPSVLGLLVSLQFLIMATVGGLRSVWGGPVGAFVIVTLTQVSRETLPRIAPNVGGEYEIIVYGLALVLVLLFLPDGIAGGLQRAGRRLRGRRTTPSVSASGDDVVTASRVRGV